MSAARAGSVRPDPGCSRGLLWRVHVAPGLDPSVADRRFRAAGFERVRAAGGVVFYEDGRGDALVFVPRTGRVQIRLHYLVPHAERDELARAVGGAILRAFGEGAA